MSEKTKDEIEQEKKEKLIKDKLEKQNVKIDKASGKYIYEG